MTTGDRVGELRSYLAGPSLEAGQGTSGAGALVRRLVPRRLRPILRAAATDALRVRTPRDIATAQTRSPLLLHLGSGLTYKEGWVNIDLVGARVDVPWNLARGIPFLDGSVDGIFHEHLLEHLTLREAFELTRECRRVLKAGAVLRAGVPDAGACLRSYAGQADPDWASSRPTGMLAVQALFYEHGHRSMYDAETLTLMCRAAGFGEVAEREWGAGRLVPNPDSAKRYSGTLYVEAVNSQPGLR